MNVVEFSIPSIIPCFKKSFDQIKELLNETLSNSSSSNEYSLSYCFKVIYNNVTKDILKLLFEDYVKLFYRCISSRNDEAIYWCLKILLFSLSQTNSASFLINLDYSQDGFTRIATSRVNPLYHENHATDATLTPLSNCSHSLRGLFIEFYFKLIYIFDDQNNFVRTSESLWQPIYSEIVNDDLEQIKIILNHTQSLSKSSKRIILKTLTLKKITNGIKVSSNPSSSSSLLSLSSLPQLQKETGNIKTISPPLKDNKINPKDMENNKDSTPSSDQRKIEELIIKFLVQNEVFQYSSSWFKGLKPLIYSTHYEIITNILKDHPGLINEFLPSWINNWEPEVSDHFVKSTNFLIEMHKMISHDPIIPQMTKLSLTRGLLYPNDQVLSLSCQLLLAYLESFDRHVMRLEMANRLSERNQIFPLMKGSIPDIKTVLNTLGKYFKMTRETKNLPEMELKEIKKIQNQNQDSETISIIIDRLIVIIGYYSKYFGRINISSQKSIIYHSSIVKIIPNLILNDLWKRENNHLMKLLDYFNDYYLPHESFLTFPDSQSINNENKNFNFNFNYYQMMIKAILKSSLIFPKQWINEITMELLNPSNQSLNEEKIKILKSFMNEIKTFRCNQNILPDNPQELLKHFNLFPNILIKLNSETDNQFQSNERNEKENDSDSDSDSENQKSNENERNEKQSLLGAKRIKIENQIPNLFLDQDHVISTLLNHLKIHSLDQIRIPTFNLSINSPEIPILLNGIGSDDASSLLSQWDCGSWCQILAYIFSIEENENNKRNNSNYKDYENNPYRQPLLDARTIISNRMLLFPLFYLCSLNAKHRKIGRYLLEKFVSIYLLTLESTSTSKMSKSSLESKKSKSKWSKLEKSSSFDKRDSSTVQFRQQKQILLLFSILQTTLQEGENEKLNPITAVFICESCRVLINPDHPMYLIIMKSLLKEQSFNPFHSSLIIFKIIDQNQKELAIMTASNDQENSNLDHDEIDHYHDKYWNRIKWSLRIIESGLLTMNEVESCYKADVLQNIATMYLLKNHLVFPIIKNIIEKIILIANNDQSCTNNVKGKDLKNAIKSLALVL